MSKKSFLKGAAILGVAGLLVQVMGAIFRIPLGNIIGDDGMGYYQTAYPIYVFLLVFSTNGAPAAISKMTSERIAVGRNDEAHRVFKLSFILMFALGIVASSIFFFGAEPIVKALGNPGAYYAMLSIAPALLFVPIMAVFRGYFQGMQEMGPTAVSQLTEQAVRVAIGLILAVMLVPKGLEYAAAGATVGTSIGPIAGVAILIVIYLYKKSKLPLSNETKDTSKESAGSILKTLAAIAVPITIGVSILPIMNIADVI
ncbi:polysaccharide biosynthesis protein, partial [Aminipila sp.]|uniref:polysaccharide biosynthesis protein n=1 Tax=Aminipila sp. TaxID=2060095 RepID=UPI00289E5B8F